MNRDEALGKLLAHRAALAVRAVRHEAEATALAEAIAAFDEAIGKAQDAPEADLFSLVDDAETAGGLHLARELRRGQSPAETRG